ncbi:ATP-binding cassette domain-containing protein [Weissella confusa]|uniref:ATP-binding cassette domain-containing protein n=1 Tax=Weissella confusa TaxID=1583 RepID=A0A923SNT1_WEICO|nr:ATP-binding cassette domain-containing protein [Weissella confusa]
MGNGLDSRLNVATGDLSGGQRQALSFLMATRLRPELLLLDAGKSTLFNVIAGSLALTSGHIYLGDEDVTRLSETQRTKFLARVFQDPKLGTAPRMTVAENLLFAERRHSYVRC